MTEEIKCPTFYYYVLREAEISGSRKQNTIEDAVAYAERRAVNHNEPYVIFSSDRILKPVSPKIEQLAFRFDWDVNYKKPELQTPAIVTTNSFFG